VVYGRSNDIYFNGAIDDVMIFDSELSSDEIKAMYNRGFSLGWDDNGNMTANDMINGTDTTLQYNWDNKLRSATKGTKSISIRYDPGGNRIWKQSIDGAEETTRKYIVDIVGGLPTTLMEMKDVNDTIIKTYVYANGQPLCQNDGDYSTPRYFYIHDRLGSVRQIINTSASVVRYYTYEPFGEVLEEDGTLTNYMMFTAQYFDTEIDQYYLRARQYDPHISRFSARDPIDGQFKQPLTFHKYLYCLNDSINKIDPLGLFIRIPGGGLYHDYGETQDIITSAVWDVSQGLIMGPWNAFGGGGTGDYDFRVKAPKDMFDIGSGEVLGANRFGNYLAGYANYFCYLGLGEAGTRAMGHYYAIPELFSDPVKAANYWTLTSVDLQYLPDDYGSRYWITRGVLDAHLRLRELGVVGGPMSRIAEIQTRISLRVYQALYKYEQFVGYSITGEQWE